MEREALVENVTKIIMERLNSTNTQASTAQVVSFGDVPPGLLGAGVTARPGRTAGDVDGAQYIVLTQDAFRVLHGGVVPVALAGGPSVTVSPAPGAPASNPSDCCSGQTFDLTGKKVIGDRDVRALGLTSGAIVRVDASAIVTALARDYATSAGATIAQ